MTATEDLATGRTDVRSFRAAGVIGFALAVWYAVFVRFYQGAGGTIGLPGVIRDRPSFQWASYQAGLLILVGGAACLVLTRPWARRVPVALPRIGGRELGPRLIIPLIAGPCLIGGVFAVCHWLGASITCVLELAGLITIDRPLIMDPTPQVTLQGDLWNLFLYEPWFGAMGISLALCCLHYARQVALPGLLIKIVGAAAIGLCALLTAGSVVSIALGITISLN